MEQEYLTFAASAPFVALILAGIKSVVAIPARAIWPAALALTALWGGVLMVSDGLAVTPAQFVLTAVLTSFSASGMQGQMRTFFPEALRVPITDEAKRADTAHVAGERSAAAIKDKGTP